MARMINFLRQHSDLSTILALSLVVRVVYLLLYNNLPEWDQLTIDNYYHHNWAISIAQGNVFGDTTYFRAPFYVFCLAGLYSFLGTSLWVARIFGLTIGLLSILMTYLIATRVFDRKVGLLAALIHTFYPICIYFESELLLDPTFTLLFQVALYRVLIWWETERTRDIFYTGLFLGLAAITRPTALIVVPLAMLVIFSVLHKRGAAVRQSAILILGIALVVAPVTIRNVAVAGDPVLIASQGGINLYIGNNDDADGFSAVMPEPLGYNWRISQITHIAETDEGRTLKPGEVSSYWTSEAIGWILNNPGAFLSMYAKKLYHHISDREISNNRQISIFADKVAILKYNPLSFGILFALAAAGVLFCFGTDRRAAFLVVVILSYTVVSALFFFSSRFRLPLLSLYFVLSAATLVWLTTTLLSRFRAALPVITGAIVFGFISYYPFVTLPPGYPSQHCISEGLYWFSHTEYERALESFQLAQRIDPDFPETNLNLGNTYLRMGQVDSARDYFIREEALHPGRAKANTNLATIHLLRGDRDSALTEINMALEAAPYDPVSNIVYLRIIFADSLLGNEETVVAINQAAIRTGDDIFVLNDAAILLSDRGKLSQAQAILRRAIASAPPPIETDDYAFEQNFRNSEPSYSAERARSYYQLGFLYGIQGDYAPAIEFSSLAIAADSNLVEAYINLVSGYLSTGQSDTARQVLSTACAKFPHNEYLLRLKVTLMQ